jgi:hypothetical protein
MIIESALIITISCNMLSYPNYQVFELNGDYSEEAKHYMQSIRDDVNSFDPNDILYRVIAKELENEINSQPQVDK